PNDNGKFVGIRIGIDVTSKSAAGNKYSNMIVTSATPYMWLNAAETAFLRAEYELRWGSAETARSLYEEGVRLSFEERGAAGADAYLADTESKPAPYSDPLSAHSVSLRQSQITVAWETAGEEDDADAIRERNLERIITQKWIAIFPLGVEAWSEYRRTGYPRLLPAVENKSGGTVDLAHGARRLPYPVEEYQRNNANLQSAIQLLDSETQGSRKGDIMGTRVWWDCKPYNN
ncbi:MAG: SusD/RagB family nutrient-binding outer membrane lipoprotein, partial [Alistipes sp.]|nr:SusD/RagB family nutrient-binding outer membrane lipoprotein [Alistipes sp.]